MEQPMIGRRMRLAREAAGVKQIDLALHLGRTKNHLSTVENGRTKPSQELVAGYEDALGLPAGTLWREDFMALVGNARPTGNTPDAPASIPAAAPLLSARAALIERALHDPAPAVRREAVEALGHLWGNDIDAALARLMADPDEAIRLAAIRAFGASLRAAHAAATSSGALATPSASASATAHRQASAEQPTGGNDLVSPPASPGAAPPQAGTAPPPAWGAPALRHTSRPRPPRLPAAFTQGDVRLFIEATGKDPRDVLAALTRPRAEGGLGVPLDELDEKFRLDPRDIDGLVDTLKLPPEAQERALALLRAEKSRDRSHPANDPPHGGNPSETSPLSQRNNDNGSDIDDDTKSGIDLPTVQC
jgi:transcriptional regulator with XRE-family HTH domain